MKCRVISDQITQIKTECGYVFNSEDVVVCFAVLLFLYSSTLPSLNRIRSAGTLFL